MVTGVLGDQVSTAIGLSKNNFEASPSAAGLMVRGIWMSFDLTLIAVCILVSFIVMRLVKHPWVNA